MKAVITGGSGFVGTHLSRYLLETGHSVTAIGSRSNHSTITHSRFSYASADTTLSGQWQKVVADADMVFNLTGRSIFQRWSRRNKQEMYDSRILTTRNVVEAMPQGAKSVLVSTSAVGYYGNCGDTELTEDSPSGNDFLSGLAKDWESEAEAAQAKGARVVIARFGLPLGVEGGAMAKMIPAFRSFVGGPLGDGRQWFPWIHIRDLVAALAFLAFNKELEGSFNICAPYPVRNKELATALGKALGRPAFMAAPAFMLKMVMGDLATVLLGSQRTIPVKLLASGFEFQYPQIDGALEDIVCK